MKQIPLSKGKVATVDDADFEWLNQWKWTAIACGRTRKFFYAYRYPGTRNKRKLVLMHRVIARASESEMVDHRDLDTLNNQRSNLRICTRSQNNHNCRVKKNNKAGIKGIHFEKDSQKWIAEICVNYRRIKLGRFSDPLKASQAYDKACEKYFGDFARTNKSLTPCQQ